MYVTSDNNTIDHRCVALLYFLFSIQPFATKAQSNSSFFSSCPFESLRLSGATKTQRLKAALSIISVPSCLCAFVAKKSVSFIILLSMQHNRIIFKYCSR